MSKMKCHVYIVHHEYRSSISDEMTYLIHGVYIDKEKASQHVAKLKKLYTGKHNYISCTRHAINDGTGQLLRYVLDRVGWS